MSLIEDFTGDKSSSDENDILRGHSLFYCRRASGETFTFLIEKRYNSGRRVIDLHWEIKLRKISTRDSSFEKKLF